MTKEIYIDGMHCGHCVEAVRDALSDIDGVKNVSVDLKKRKAVVDVDNVDNKTLSDAIEDVGFYVECID